jgi:hypothetical protein
MNRSELNIAVGGRDYIQGIQMNMFLPTDHYKPAGFLTLTSRGGQPKGTVLFFVREKSIMINTT